MLRVAIYGCLLFHLSLSIVSAAMAESNVSVSKSDSSQIRSLFQMMAHAFAEKDPDTIVALWAINYTSTDSFWSAPKHKDFRATLSRRNAELNLRSLFPGNDHGPREMYLLRSVSVKGNHASVVAIRYRITPIDGSQPDGGNADGYAVVAYTCVRRDGGSPWLISTQRRSDLPVENDYKRLNEEFSDPKKEKEILQ